MSNLEAVARAFAERTVRGSLLCDPEWMRFCGQEPYGEGQIRHYVETRWKDYAELIVEGEQGRSARPRPVA